MKYKLGLAKNVDQAIRCFEAALRACSKDNFPEEWSDAQHNLLNAIQVVSARAGGHN